MMLVWLAAALRAEGATVVEQPGWQTRTQPSRGREYTPVGIMNHHTAPPVPYPVDALLKSCNLNIKPNGTIYVIAAGYEWDSGTGNASVLHLVEADTPPPGDATKRGSTNGNPYFVDIEVDHLGDGSPIPAVQLDALITADTALCRHQGWSPNRIIGHREWTSRKTDPRWNGNANPMPGIRAAVAARLGLPPPPPTTEELEMYRTVTDRDGYGTADGDPAVKEWQILLGFTGDDVDGKYGPATAARVAAIAGGAGTTIGPLEGALILAHAAGPPIADEHVHTFQGTTGPPI